MSHAEKYESTVFTTDFSSVDGPVTECDTCLCWYMKRQKGSRNVPGIAATVRSFCEHAQGIRTFHNNTNLQKKETKYVGVSRRVRICTRDPKGDRMEITYIKTVVPSLGVITMLPVSSCCKEIRMRNRGAEWLARERGREVVHVLVCAREPKVVAVRPRPPSVDTCGTRRTHSDAGTIDGHGGCCENETESTHSSCFRKKICDDLSKFFTKAIEMSPPRESKLLEESTLGSAVHAQLHAQKYEHRHQASKLTRKRHAQDFTVTCERSCTST